MSDLKSTKKEVTLRNVDDQFAHGDNEEKDETQESEPQDGVQEEAEQGTEETPADSSPAEASEDKEGVEEDVNELSLLKESIKKLEEENSHVKEAMQKRIDELTWKLKNQEELSEKNKERTWDDVTDPEEIKRYIAHYTSDGNGEMVAFLTDKLADAKIQKRFAEQTSKSRSQQVRAQTWDKTVEEFPDLKNTESEHYKRTLELVNKDPRYNDIENFPEGHAVAARMVAVDLLKEKLRASGMETKKADATARKQISQNALDASSGKKVSPTNDNKLQSMMERAMDSKNPYGAEWKQVLREISKKRSSS